MACFILYQCSINGCAEGDNLIRIVVMKIQNIENRITKAFVIIGLIIILFSIFVFVYIVKNTQSTKLNQSENVVEKAYHKWTFEYLNADYDIAYFVDETPLKSFDGCKHLGVIPSELNEQLYLVEKNNQNKKYFIKNLCGLGPQEKPEIFDVDGKIYIKYYSGEGDVVDYTIIRFDPLTKEIKYKDFYPPELKDIFAKTSSEEKKLYEQVFKNTECWSGFNVISINSKGILAEVYCYFLGNRKYDEAFGNRPLVSLELDIDTGNWMVHEVYTDRIIGLKKYADGL